MTFILSGMYWSLIVVVHRPEPSVQSRYLAGQHHGCLDGCGQYPELLEGYAQCAGVFEAECLIKRLKTLGEGALARMSVEKTEANSLQDGATQVVLSLSLHNIQ